MKSPTDFFRNDRPYESCEEYLSELLVLMNLRVQRYLRDHRDYYEGRSFPSLPDFQTVLHILSVKLKQDGLEGAQDLEKWEMMIYDRLELTEIVGEYLALEYLASKMGMEDFGKGVLMFSLMAALDTTWHGIFQYLNESPEKSFPTLELCGRILQKPEQSVFQVYHQIYGRIRDYLILFPTLQNGNGVMTQPLVCDARLLDVLLGRNRGLSDGIDILEGNAEDPLWFREKEMDELESFSEDKQFPVFVVCGERGSGRKHLLRHFAKKHNLTLTLFDNGACEGEEEDFERMIERLRYGVRECVLWTTPLVIQGIDSFSQGLKERLLIHLKEAYQEIVQLIFVLLEEESFASEIAGVYILRLKQFDEIQRMKLWQRYKAGYFLDAEIQLESVANTFSLTPGKIKAALYQAAISSGGPKKTIKKKMLYQACYGQIRHRLEEKTEKITPAFTWEDLKMEAGDKQILADICSCVKNRHIVMTKWNFSKVVPYGAGVTVLFSGPPGTGKTMAAQVIAGELQMELYKIDLSQLLDKYIGETEKNIKSVFDQAQKSNCILFFDEADAIFNKRLEANNANERFANIESSLLLQCIESYRGISILATNNYNAIDAAFIRRFKYYLLFREPDETTRYEIWRSVFPPEAPIASDVDLRLFAHLFELTGAVIKNIALAAAYLAADKQEPISNLHILKATRRELQKANLVLSKEKLGSLGYLFSEIIE